jgi:hypothetical protein
MLALQRSKQPLDKCSPNVLPCRISYTGPSKVTKRFWSPSLEKGRLNTPRIKSSFIHPRADSALDQTKTAYFRGRKLRGRIVKVPEGYEGMLCHLPQLSPAFNSYDPQVSLRIQQTDSFPLSLRRPARQFWKNRTRRIWRTNKALSPSKSSKPLRRSTSSPYGAMIKYLRLTIPS